LKPIILSQWKCGLKKEFFKVVGSAATVGRTDCSDHTILVELLTFADFCFFLSVVAFGAVGWASGRASGL